MMEIGVHKFDRDTVDYVATGRKLRLAREKTGKPVSVVAKYLEKTVQSVYGYETGKTAIPLGDFVSLCSLYDLKTDAIICKKTETGKYCDYDE